MEDSLQIGGGPPDGSSHEEKVLRLPDGNMVVVGDEAFKAPELMFNPDLIKKSYSGLHLLVRSFLKINMKVLKKRGLHDLAQRIECKIIP